MTRPGGEKQAITLNAESIRLSASDNGKIVVLPGDLVGAVKNLIGAK